MGLWVVLVPPSPKVQAQLVGLPVLVSVDVTVWPVVAVAVERLKAAVGTAGAALTVRVRVTGVLEPAALVAVRVTV